MRELTNNDLQELHLELVGNKGSGKTKDALVAALLVEGAADFTILRKKCIPVERTRTLIWELDGTESTGNLKPGTMKSRAKGTQEPADRAAPT